MDYLIRRARTSDVGAISALVAQNVDSGRLLAKATVTLYEDVQEFWVAERTGDGLVAGCGALHVMWEDYTEIHGTPVSPQVYAELLRSYDEGVAEFLDLDRVKPNTLGNTRMLCHL